MCDIKDSLPLRLRGKRQTAAQAAYLGFRLPGSTEQDFFPASLAPHSSKTEQLTKPSVLLFKALSYVL